MEKIDIFTKPAFVGYAYTIVVQMYPLVQAYGMLFLKDSSDPLRGVSRMDLIIIYSSNQKKLSSYEEVMMKGLEY